MIKMQSSVRWMLDTEGRKCPHFPETPKDSYVDRTEYKTNNQLIILFTEEIINETF